MFSVRGSGNLDSAGGAVLRGNKGLEVHGGTLLKGKVALHRATLKPVLTSSGVLQVTVPLTATYVVITTADRAAATSTTAAAATTATAVSAVGVEIVFATTTTGDAAEDKLNASAGVGETHSFAQAGRVVMVCNLDEHTTFGAVAVPSHSTVMLVFDGLKWTSVDALKAPMHVS